ncbi:MAG: hypothetical protein A2X49_01555 [Lentisphaerae bacterium GWF2_52_8]|nr:MAG: hypothetical protein A2X49_01555 [Lentisphaerae bacterium GWF2_52_8]
MSTSTSSEIGKDRHGFTLIELLVVTGIIAILIGLSFPVIGKMRERGRKAACLSNLHQIGSLVLSYIGHNNDILPICQRIGDSPADPLGPQNVLANETERKIFKCPSDSGEDSCFQKYGSSYEWNPWLNAKKIDRSNLSVLGVEIQLPLLGDACDFHKGSGRNYLYSDGQVSQSLEVKIK